MMVRMRRVLGLVAIVWLVGQVGLSALTLLLLETSGPALSEAACTCTHGPDAACPMHRNTAPGSRTCVLRGAGDHTAILLGSLFATTGLAMERMRLLAPATSGSVAIGVCHMIIRQPGSPDPPPPRA
jgi:hypothetical protein